MDRLIEGKCVFTKTKPFVPLGVREKTDNTENSAVEHWKRALVIINPVAGDGRSASVLPELVRALSESGCICTAVTTTGRGAATDYVKKLGRSCELLVCSGGDGTANEVISGLMCLESEQRPIFAYIPSGSTNDFASTLGLPKKTKDIISMIAEGASVPVDVGMMNGRCFTNLCAFGAFTDISHTTSQTAKNTFGMLAYFAKGLESLRQITPIKARFEINGEVIEDDFGFCAIANTHIIGGGVIRLKQQLVEINDGLFEIILIKYPTDAIGVSKIAAAIASGEMRCEYIRIFHAGEVRLTILSEPVNFTLDGELEKNVAQAHIVNIRSAIRVVTGGE